MTVLLLMLGALVGASAACLLVLPRARAAAARAAAELALATERAERDRAHRESLWDAERAGHERRLAELRRVTEEKLSLVQGNREQLAEQMKAISADVLRQTTEQAARFAASQRATDREAASGELARRTTEFSKAVAPLEAQLRKLEAEVTTLERERRQTQGTVTQMLRSVSEELGRLRGETGTLVSALKRPQVRGSWGEMQLRNCVEAANMVEHVDFTQQQTIDAGIDGRLRPDMVVHLPGAGRVVVDAKVPMDAYLQALEVGDEARQSQLLDRHAAQLRAHVDSLGSKAYHAQFHGDSPDFVVCFVPNEAVYCAALERDATLLEHGAAKDVLIATPMSLLALLKAVAYGWRQERIAESAREIAEAARELHKRVCTFLEPFAKVGKHLNTTVNAYNQATSSLEARVLPQLRRMEDAGAGSAKQLSAPAPVETPARLLAAPELLWDDDAPSAPAVPIPGLGTAPRDLGARRPDEGDDDAPPVPEAA